MADGAEALARLKQACEGRSRDRTRVVDGQARRVQAFVACHPEDVVAVCDLIPEAKRGQKVQDLRYGAVRAGSKEEICLQVHCLDHLLAAAEANKSPAKAAEPKG